MLPTRFHSESLKVIYCHHISQPCAKTEALLMIKDKAEAWMENQLPFLYAKAQTARYFHSNGNILHKFYRSIVETLIYGIWGYFLFQSISLSLSLPPTQFPSFLSPPFSLCPHTHTHPLLVLFLCSTLTNTPINIRTPQIALNYILPSDCKHEFHGFLLLHIAGQI